jgi:hypothetical protein
MFRNTKTGEEKEVFMRISELDEWKSENPDWISIMKSAPKVCNEIGGSLKKAGDGWKEVLSKIKEKHVINNIRD